ncbi:hypothetical protein, partial [uncultured Granulicatella sp.]|uniref:hypothetical protein n=1 Tax=uncultured Granulicatella sp. TaxID=316089 RepID=UPI0028DB15C3
SIIPNFVSVMSKTVKPSWRFPVKISRKGYFYFYYVEIRVLFFSFFCIGRFLKGVNVRKEVATNHLC